MEVPFFDLAAQQRFLKGDILPALEQTLLSGRYVLGDNVAAFEEAIASYIGVASAVGLNSGTDALRLSLQALAIGPGDEVIVPAFGFVAAAECVDQVGASLVLADIDPRTFNLDPSDVARRMTRRTKAIIPIHLFGQAALLAELLALCNDWDIALIEDTAQALGGRYCGRLLGGWGRVGCFSFYPTKTLGSVGDAGMVTTNDEAVAKRLRGLRNHGVESRYDHRVVGWNSRLDEVQAAVLRVKLPYLERWNRKRAAIAARYSRRLADTPVKTPILSHKSSHVFSVYAILTSERDRLKEHLASAGIQSIIYYPQPLHLQAAYRHLGYNEGDFPAAEEVARTVLPLPIYPELSDEQVDYVSDRIHAFFA